MLDRLTTGLGASAEQVYEIEGQLDLADLSQIAALDRPELKDEPWVPVTQARLARIPPGGAFFDELQKGDIVVHQPYESFRTSFEAFAQAAAEDPDVIAIKTTVYRTGDDSTLVGALIDCAEQGKQSVCLVELKARFDERRNIEWSRAMEQAGVHVVHGFSDLKIHAKMALIVRREGNGLRRYVHIGSGNYNAGTARIYEDVGVFTADEDIAADVADLFNHLTGFGRPQRFRKLLVAPFSMRTRLLERDPPRHRRRRRRREDPHPAQAQPAGRSRADRGAVRRSPGGRADRDLRARDLHAAARRRRDVRDDQRPLDLRTLPRAQPDLLLRGEQREHDVHRQRRPDAAKPRPSRRGADADRQRPDAAGAECDSRQRLLRQHKRLGALG